MNRIVIVAAPLFTGRPEVEITSLIKRFMDENSIHNDIIYSLIQDINDGKSVYDNKQAIRHFSDSTFDLINKVQNGDTIFWIDGFNPSFPLFQYHCILNEIKVFNVCILHSSPTIEGDYLQHSLWAKHFNEYLSPYFDLIFTGTKYMKRELVKCGYDSRRGIVTGLPMDLSCFASEDKEYSIIFNHRWCIDKRSDQFVRLAYYWKENVADGLLFKIFTPSLSLYEELKDVDFVKYKVIEVVYNHSKSIYYNNLRKVKYIWSGAQLETFGYSVLDGVLSGAIPILNVHPCYTELYPDNIYHNFDEQIKLIKTGKACEKSEYDYKIVVQKMIEAIRKL